MVGRFIPIWRPSGRRLARVLIGKAFWGRVSRLSDGKDMARRLSAIQRPLVEIKDLGGSNPLTAAQEQSERAEKNGGKGTRRNPPGLERKSHLVGE